MENSPAEDQEKKGADALADDLERGIKRVEERSEDLGNEIDHARQDWEAKQADPAVPGATGDSAGSDSGARDDSGN